MSYIGPHGEIYPTQPTKEQIFREVREPSLDRMSTPAGGAQQVVALLRQLAESIERHAIDLRTTPDGKPITSRLCSVGLSLIVEDPPRHCRAGEDLILNSYRLTATARLGFE